ncbi:MAG TPA: ABC transporter ATP-binding protein [Dehalococcoidia bacterium]|nr:ABC transporter ATP-binding protein [Dehalococcoidia bacterium]
MTACSVSLENVSHSFAREDGSLHVLNDVSLDAGAGEFVSIVGPSGCGKSTLLRIIGGLVEPSAGRVLIDGEEPRRAQRQMKVGYVFQEPALLPWRSVRQNVELPLEVGRRNASEPTGPVHPFPAEPADGAKTGALLELVGLADFENYPPRQLSGGMQQRVAIARALSFNPPLLLMDEPFGALDEITREAMRLELQRIWAGDQKTVLFVTHSVREAILLSDRVVVLSPRPGRVVATAEIDLPRPRDQAVEDSAEFLAYLDELRGALRVAA